MPEPRISQQCRCVFCSRPSDCLRLGVATRRSHIWGILVLLLVFSTSSYAQSVTATLTGTVEDQNGAVIGGANISLTDAEKGTQRLTTSSHEGNFIFALIPPGKYSLTATAPGFTPIEMKVVLNVNDQVALRIQLNVGPINQTILVADQSLVDESPAVGTVVDNQFVQNIPLNGRSFQSLISLTPGVVVTKTTNTSQGQFSMNGQRANANYFTVDGVGANIAATTTTFSQTAAGTLPGLSANGTTNNLVSVEAMQEFKIQTSTYAPEFGRTPGGQVSIVTRSGTNDFHGTLFEYFRNDALDATDWFANATRQRKPPLRQNDFGGVVGGPMYLPRFGEGGPAVIGGRNRSFFFFSYEGLRLRQPQVANTTVPTVAVRQLTPAALKPFINAYPLPNGAELAGGVAGFTASYSNPSTLDTTSLRIDHVFSKNLTVFGRYNHSNSSATVRRPAVSNISLIDSSTRTFTIGATSIPSSLLVNEVRANYSRSEGGNTFGFDNFGGAVVPGDSQIFPSFTSGKVAFMSVTPRPAPGLSIGLNGQNVQRQFNLVDNLSVSKGSHQLKFGLDYRYLSPIFEIREYDQVVTFPRLIGNPGAPPPAVSFVAGRASSVTVSSRDPVALRFTNLSLYGQDTWRVSSRLLLTYGLRWELNPPPTGKNGKDLFTVTGLDNPPTVAVAPRGTPLWNTTYNNLAPRVGVAYHLRRQQGAETLLKGGFGVFYDLGAGNVGDNAVNFPYIRRRNIVNNTAGVPYPLAPASALPPAFTLTPTSAQVAVFEPDIKLPRAYQWNVTVEQSLGTNQVLSAAYVAAIGRDFLRQEIIASGNASISSVLLTRNAATSDYHSFQLQFQRRLSRGIQALTSYTWAHSIDNVSSDTSVLIPSTTLDPNIDRGPSDFDVRHSLVGAVTYNIPAVRGSLGRKILKDFSFDTIFRAQSASPVNVITGDLVGSAFGFAFEVTRPNVITAAPLYLNDPIFPGGKRINPAAFVTPVFGQQGTLGRNALRGFPLWQVDAALRRQINLNDRVNLQFRVEAFNLFNHPNFADPKNSLADPQFGFSTQMLSTSLGSGGTSGGLNPLYQVGGPRSMQVVLKFQF
jgi:hypothetical protein